MPFLATKVDKAQLRGGIDLNEAILSMEVKKDGKTFFKFDPQVIKNIRLEGIRPVIIQIDRKPVNIPMLMGATESQMQAGRLSRK